MPKKRRQNVKKQWQELAEEAQEYRDRSIARIHPPIPLPSESDLPNNVMLIPNQLLEKMEVEITEKSPEELLQLLSTGRVTATAIILAFLRRAGLAQTLTNCITELLPERALARARELDQYFTKHQKPIGPLHGLPISVKEQIGIKGLRLNIAGYVAWFDEPSAEDALVLQILWRAGAVFHARTTQPQSMMHLETDSNIYGVTLNPYNRNLSSGGSSGGEGALIGIRGSCLGIGTDIGGSIRSPAAGNGLYGLKPTAYRIPTKGWSSTAPGADAIQAVIGPLSTSLTGIDLFMHTVLSAKPWILEPALIPLPWRPISISSNQPLKIAIMWHDDIVKPHPPITRALLLMKSHLLSLPNVELVDWIPHQHDEAWAIISSLYYSDGGAEDAEIISKTGEPWLPLTDWIIKKNPCALKLNMRQFYYWQEEREAYRSEYAARWNETASGRDPETGELIGMVDAILCPAGPGVAQKHDTARYWGYTSQWNLLDYPALVFPVCKVDKSVDILDVEYEPMTDVDKENWELYDASIFEGLPVSLQLVGRRFEDEKILAILQYFQQRISVPFTQFP